MSAPKTSPPPPLSGGADDCEGFESLAELALDVRSSWNHATDPVWRRLDPVLWNLTRNPWVVLQTVSRDTLREAMADTASNARKHGAIDAALLRQSGRPRL